MTIRLYSVFTATPITLVRFISFIYIYTITDLHPTPEIFKRLFPLAKQHKLRIVALNRRDYDGSSLFSPAELRVLNGPDSLAHADFLNARGSEIANFLAWLVNKENMQLISVHDDNKQSGGVVVLGWSAGNITTVAFLANMDTYPDPVRSVLDSHIRAQFIYGSSIHLCNTSITYSVK